MNREDGVLLPATTHCNIFSSPALASAVTPFLGAPLPAACRRPSELRSLGRHVGQARPIRLRRLVFLVESDPDQPGYGFVWDVLHVYLMARSRRTAAVMRERWVKACGKLPRASPEEPSFSA